MFAPIPSQIVARPAVAGLTHPVTASAPTDGVPHWHAGFLRLLPAIQKHACVEFRHLTAEAREEAVQEVVVNAMVAYARLVHQGKQDVAYASPLARFAIAQFRTGRLTGTKMNVRDVTSFYCQCRKSIVVERLDCWDENDESWREVLVEDRTCGPAELAASRIDFIAWQGSLPARDRKIAKLLASGCGTSEVAAKVRLSWARISQMRRELKASWEEFHEPKDVGAAGELSGDLVEAA